MIKTAVEYKFGGFKRSETRCLREIEIALLRRAEEQ